MDALLQAFGLGLGAAVYVLVALWLLRSVRAWAGLSVALYWRLRNDREERAQVVQLRARQERWRRAA